MLAFVRALASWGFINLQNWRLNAAAVVRRIQIGIIVAGTILFGIALCANIVAEAYWVNGVLTVVWPIIIAILATMATSIIATIGLGIISEEGLKKYEAFCWGAALFGSLVFATLTVIPMGENPARASLILVGLVLIGLGTKVFGWAPKYYEKYVIAIITVTLVVGVVGLLSPAQRINLFRIDPFAYFHVPKDKEVAVRTVQQMERNREEAEAQVQSALYTATRAGKSLNDADLRKVVAASNGEVVVNDRFVERVDPLKSQVIGIDRKYAIREFRGDFAGDIDKLCGFEPGKKYRFEVKGTLSVRHPDLGSKTMPLQGVASDANGQATPGPESRMWALIIGDTLPDNGEFKADERGCEPRVVINIDQVRRSSWQVSGTQEIPVVFYTGFRL